jgi:hypothetical protein
MYSKDKEINRLNTLNEHSTSTTFRNSVELANLESTTISDFLAQLSLADEGRWKAEHEGIKKRSADILDTIGKAIATAKAEEQRQKEEAERLRLRKLEEERQEVSDLSSALTGNRNSRDRQKSE